MLLFKINSLIKKYFDDFLNGYNSLAVTFADWLTGLVFHSHTDFIALVPPSVERNKVCINDYTWTAHDCFFNNNFSEF